MLRYAKCARSRRLEDGREGEVEKAAAAVTTKPAPITSFLAHHLFFWRILTSRATPIWRRPSTFTLSRGHVPRHASGIAEALTREDRRSKFNTDISRRKLQNATRVQVRAVPRPI
jgi:hypothetical protein